MATSFKDLSSVIHKSAELSWKTLELFADPEPYLPVLNGVIGDTLHAKESPLAIPMTLLGEIKGGKLCVLVHGLCDSEKTWCFEKDPSLSYGSLLKNDLGFSPLYLRYNSGLHISTNGRSLARLLGEACKKAPVPVQEIIFIGHSMGGLIVRSACHYGKAENAPWVQCVKKIFFLGTPHLGSDYEKLGNLTSVILKLIPNPVTWGIATLGNRRSAGIKDLRFGYLLDEDWMEQDEDALLRDNRHPVPLLEGADHYLITGALAKKSDNIFTRYFGDGVIPLRSATGRSFVKTKALPFFPHHLKTVRGLSHVRLTRHRKVYKHIREWCGEKTGSG